jgi:hypothetical protein
MDKAPNDILLLIFDIHIHDHLLSATSLLTVCRRWHDLLLANPSFWSRVTLNIISIETVSTILTKGRYGLEAYLARSDKDSANVLLHIDIRWEKSNNIVEEHNKVCPHLLTEKGHCTLVKCGLYKQRKQQLQNLFKVLIGAPKNNYFNRWATIKLDLSHFYETTPIEDEFDQLSLFDNASNVTIPNLHTIELYNATVYFNSINIPCLKRLVQDGYTSTSTITVANNVEILGILNTERKKRILENEMIPVTTWPRLHTLRISGLNLLPSFQGDVPLRLTTLIIDVMYRGWGGLRPSQAHIDGLNKAKTLNTVILLGATPTELKEILRNNPGLAPPNLNFGSPCYLPHPCDDRMAPRYRSRPRGACGGSAKDASTFMEIFLTLRSRKMKIESLDPCITDAFATFYARMFNKFRTQVIEPVLTDAEFDRIKEYQKTIRQSTV